MGPKCCCTRRPTSSRTSVRKTLIATTESLARSCKYFPITSAVRSSEQHGDRRSAAVSTDHMSRADINSSRIAWRRQPRRINLATGNGRGGARRLLENPQIVRGALFQGQSFADVVSRGEHLASLQVQELGKLLGKFANVAKS